MERQHRTETIGGRDRQHGCPVIAARNAERRIVTLLADLTQALLA